MPRTSAGGWQATVGTNIAFIGQCGYFYQQAHPMKKNMAQKKFHSDETEDSCQSRPGVEGFTLKGGKSLFWMYTSVPECDNVRGSTL